MKKIRIQGRMNATMNEVNTRSIKARSILHKESGNRWVDSDNCCCSPCFVVINESMSVLSCDVISDHYY